jgi:hypothetical protein
MKLAIFGGLTHENKMRTLWEEVKQGGGPMRLWSISRVNKPENDDASIVEPIELTPSERRSMERSGIL